MTAGNARTEAPAPAPAPAKPSASIMLIRDGRDGLEVLMMRRAPTMAFAPGALVFPGGKVETADRQPAHWRTITDNRTWRADMPYRIAALRELYEEVGIVHARGYGHPSLRERRLDRWLRARQLRLATRSLVPFARWITPVELPKRFDTLFFLAPVQGGAAHQADGVEAVGAGWMGVSDILAGWRAGEIPLMFPTRLNLMKLATRETVLGALAAARAAPVAEVLPEITQDGKARRVRIRGGASFGASEATDAELAVEAGPKKRAAPPDKT